jgi:glutamine synthetase
MSLADASGTNLMLDTEAERGLSTLARQCIAGCLAHHEGMAAICAPTVNAYKRLRPAQLSGYWANWGIDHRACTVRVPAENTAAKRLEHRMPDGAANPYLATAAVLHAARLGVVEQLDPPPPEMLDGLEQASTERRTPANLGAALDALEADPAIIEAMGKEVVDHFLAIKRNEYEKYCAAVTDWELKHYLPFL